MKELDYVAIGKRLRAIRDALGYTQQAFAERLGVSYPTVSKWETGKALLTSFPKPRFVVLVEPSSSDGIDDLQHRIQSKV